WQSITFEGFGVLEHDNVGRVWRQPARLWEGRAQGRPSNKPQLTSQILGERHAPEAGRAVATPGLRGCRSSYADYFHLRLEEHLHFLVKRGFLSSADEIVTEIESHRALLDLPQGCLVHKDLALWNILGTPDQIAAFIDFDDAISGDPMDDLSLLACFHDAVFIQRAFEGYQSVRALPKEHLRRFWLHLLRNMIVKAVIRVGAGYFDRDDGFFLIGSGSSGASLREMTLAKLSLALRELRLM
ncbi:MAG: phosphotransferase, partial [Prosthecobacter sp.]|nr:phosphotransferase [Prosthecobacter sp.]